MSTGTNIAAGVLAGAAIAGGTYLATMNWDEEYSDDIVPIEVEIPIVEIPGIDTVNIDIANINTANINIINIDTATVDLADNRIKTIQEFNKQVATVFPDSRALAFDDNTKIDSEIMANWMNLAKERFSYTMTFKELPENIKMVAEVHHPINQQELNKNLSFYSEQGFNAVLVTFGYDGESLEQIANIMDYIKGKGFDVWFAYSGVEMLSHPILRNPEIFTYQLGTLASHADGFLTNWRRTSCHLFEPSKLFTDYMIASVRRANPEIYVVGEVYYGATASSNENILKITYNMPDNASGILITGLGVRGVAVEYVMQSVCKEVYAPKLVLIVGEKPYYNTKNSNGLGFLENMMIKEQIADRWERSGASGFIYLHGDGSDGIYSKEYTDNIAK